MITDPRGHHYMLCMQELTYIYESCMYHVSKYCTVLYSTIELYQLCCWHHFDVLLYTVVLWSHCSIYLQLLAASICYYA